MVLASGNNDNNNVSLHHSPRHFLKGNLVRYIITVVFMRTTYKQEQERDDDEYDYGDNVDKMVIIRIMVVLYDENDEN